MKKVLVVVFMLFYCMPCFAWYEVHDSQANSSLSQSLAKEIETALNTAKQVEAEIKNLTKFGGSLQFSQIQNSLQQLKALKNQTDSLVNNWQDISSKWDTIHKDYANMTGLSASNYVKLYKQQQEDKEKTTKQAMQTQGLVSQIDTDSQSLYNLLNANEGAVGALQAAQIGNQLAALQISNLMRLEQMISASNTAQMQYLVDQKEQAEAANAMSKKFIEQKYTVKQSYSIDQIRPIK